MAVRETVEIDLDLVDRLIQEQEAELEPKHRASIEYREVAERHVAGGVASSWQASPPHAIFIDRGERNRSWDIDGNEYVDYHLGYGAMVVGHAHPAIVEAIQRQARARDALRAADQDLDVIGENLAERFSLPLWRFCNSGTEATLEAARLMRAEDRPRPADQDRGDLPRPPRRADVQRDPRPRADRTARASGHRSAGARHPAGVRRPRPRRAVQRPGRGPQAFEENRGQGRRDDRRAGDDELRRRCCPSPGYLQGLKDLCHEFGAYLAFDEVKTGVTLAYGGAVEAFGVVPDIVCLAKAIGGGTPCGAIGATEELFRPVVEGEYDMAGTFNGNPLTMAAMRATLTEVLTRDAYATFERASTPA